MQRFMGWLLAIGCVGFGGTGLGEKGVCFNYIMKGPEEPSIQHKILMDPPVKENPRFLVRTKNEQQYGEKRPTRNIVVEKGDYLTYDESADGGGGSHLKYRQKIQHIRIHDTKALCSAQEKRDAGVDSKKRARKITVTYVPWSESAKSGIPRILASQGTKSDTQVYCIPFKLLERDIPVDVHIDGATITVERGKACFKTPQKPKEKPKRPLAEAIQKELSKDRTLFEIGKHRLRLEKTK